MKSFLHAAAIVGLLFLGVPTCHANSSRPNVVLIMLDDLDFDEIGAFDPDEYPTFTGALHAKQGPTLDSGTYPAAWDTRVKGQSVTQDGVPRTTKK